MQVDLPLRNVISLHRRDGLGSGLHRFGPDPGSAFGGVQIVLVGDLYQLPPVVTEAEAAFFTDPARANRVHSVSSQASARSRSIRIPSATATVAGICFTHAISWIPATSTTNAQDSAPVARTASKMGTCSA